MVVTTPANEVLQTALISQMEPVGSKYLLLTLLLKAPIHYKSGQYAYLHFEIEGTVIKRPYSIASAPRSDGIIEFCVIQASEQPELINAMRLLRVGSKLRMSLPQGKFPVPSFNTSAVFIAGGSGIAPLRSMILERLKQEPSAARTILLYGCERAELIPYKNTFDQLSELHENFEAFYYAPNSKLPGVVDGLVTEGIPHIDDLQSNFILCGPPGMIEASRRLLLQKNIKADRIFVDIY